MKQSSDTKLVRDLIARFCEDANADACVVLWCVVNKESTQSKAATWGNMLAVREMVADMHEDFEREEQHDAKKKGADEMGDNGE
jgi:hypothetical protein